MLNARLDRESWAQVADELASAIVELGRVWEAGGCRIYEEHIGSEALRHASSSCALDIPYDAGAPRAVLLTVVGERHTLGLSLAELVLLEGGWSVLTVGEGPPGDELPTLIEKLKPRLMVVSASAAMKRRGTLDYEAGLRQAAPQGVRLVPAGGGAWGPPLHAFRVNSFVKLRTLLLRFAAARTGLAANWAMKGV